MGRPPDVRVLVHPSGWEGSVVIATTPLNAGNSGGPLINSMGQVIGPTVGSSRVMTTHKTGTWPLPTEPSVKNSLTAVLTVAVIGTTTRMKWNSLGPWKNLPGFESIHSIVSELWQTLRQFSNQITGVI